MRSLIVVVFMHDRLMVIVRRETVLMFGVVVSDVRVGVQPPRLTGGRQKGHCHDEREDAVHVLSVWKPWLRVNDARHIIS